MSRDTNRTELEGASARGQPMVMPIYDDELPLIVKRIFVRSVTNFVIGDVWFCSVFKLKMGDSSKMV